MIIVNGSHGEGGGQILRTALALSAVAGEACSITNIRKNRPNPGLQNQHLEAMRAVAELCSAETKGLEMHSTEVEFHPGKISKEGLEVSIKTAGSVGLVLQPLMIAASQSGRTIDVEIKGGATNGKWAPPVNYVKHVLAPMLGKMSYKTNIEIERYGYYPKGGAHVFARLTGTKLEPVNLTERGNIIGLTGISHASAALQKAKVADRQALAAMKELKMATHESSIAMNYVETANPGSGIEIFAETENSIFGSDALGEVKKKAEDVGKEAARRMAATLKAHSCVDEYMEDQILPYMALAAEGGKSRIKVPVLTGHTKTNIWVIEKFLNVKFDVDEKSKIIICGQS